MANDNITKAELSAILEVNKNAVEIHNEVSAQYEEIIDDLSKKDDVLKDIGENSIVAAKDTQSIIKVADEIKSKISKIDENALTIKLLLTSNLIMLILNAIVNFYKK